MKRVVGDHFGDPEVLRVVEDGVPRPGPGRSGFGFWPLVCRSPMPSCARGPLGVPRPPFTPGYELVGMVEELGPGCSRLRAGDRVAALTAYGAYAECVCVPEAEAVEVPEDLDPARAVSLVLTYMTAYQLLHRMAMVKRGEAVLVHGPAGRPWAPRCSSSERWPGSVSTARRRHVTGPRSSGSARWRSTTAARTSSARVRELTGDGVNVALDGLGGVTSLRSFRALRPGGRLVVYGHYATLAGGRKSWRRRARPHRRARQPADAPRIRGSTTAEAPDLLTAIPSA